MRRLFFILLYALNVSTTYGQTPGKPSATPSLSGYQDSLVRISYEMINSPNEPERYNANYKFVKTLVSALKLPGSFGFGFDSLKAVSIQTAPDGRFRIFSWHLMNTDGSYRFYGTIQMNTPKGDLKMFPLIDYSANIKNPTDTVTNNETWYGCQYYRIVPVTERVSTPYYILLGWKGNTVKTTKKVIDVLHFENGQPRFGRQVFEGGKDWAGKQRIVFEYRRQVSMMLNYLPAQQTIVFDHLVPPDPKMENKFEFYGPDMSYDGLKLVNGKWKLVEDLPLRNAPSQGDELFGDPRHPKASAKRKIY